MAYFFAKSTKTARKNPEPVKTRPELVRVKTELQRAVRVKTSLEQERENDG